MAGPALLEALSNGWQGMMFLILRKLDSWSHLTSSMFEGMSHVDLISKDHFLEENRHVAARRTTWAGLVLMNPLSYEGSGMGDEHRALLSEHQHSGRESLPVTYSPTESHDTSIATASPGAGHTWKRWPSPICWWYSLFEGAPFKYHHQLAPIYTIDTNLYNIHDHYIPALHEFRINHTPDSWHDLYE